MLDLAALWTDTGHADTGGWSPAPAPKGMLATDVSVRHEPDIGATGSEPALTLRGPAAGPRAAAHASSPPGVSARRWRVRRLISGCPQV